MIHCLRSFCLVKSKACAHLVALGLVSMVLWYRTVKLVVLVGHIGMHRTNCSGETRLACTKHIRSRKALMIKIISTDVSEPLWLPAQVAHVAEQCLGCKLRNVLEVQLCSELCNKGQLCDMALVQTQL